MESEGWRSRGYLPHSDAPGQVQHVTFCTAGRGEGIAGHFGARLLKHDEAAGAVQQALLHFDGARYRLLAWCVMPNHVHVIIGQIEAWPLAPVLHSWKSFTAKQINRIHARNGAVWQREYYDRFMRDDRQLATAVAYVEHNPVAAGYVKKASDWPWSSAVFRTNGGS